MAKLTPKEMIDNLAMYEERTINPTSKKFPAMVVKRVPGGIDRRYKLKIGWSKIEYCPFEKEDTL